MGCRAKNWVMPDWISKTMKKIELEILLSLSLKVRSKRVPILLSLKVGSKRVPILLSLKVGSKRVPILLKSKPKSGFKKESRPCLASSTYLWSVFLYLFIVLLYYWLLHNTIHIILYIHSYIVFVYRSSIDKKWVRDCTTHTLVDINR